MTKNKKKISIFKRFGLIALSFCIAIGSFFVGVQKNGHQQSLVASAYSFNDSTFVSSDLLYGRFSNTTSTSGLTSLKFSAVYDFSTYANLSFRIRVNQYSSNQLEIVPSIKGVFNGDSPLFTNNSWYEFNSSVFYNISNSNLVPMFVFNELVSYTGVNCYGLIGFFVDYSYIKSDGSIGVSYKGVTPSGQLIQPSGDIKSIEIGSKSDFNLLGYNLSDELPTQGVEIIDFANDYWDTDFTFVCFTDTNNYRFTFVIPYFVDDYGLGNPGFNYSGILEYRKYFIQPLGNLSESDSYLAGYQQGLADNQSTIYNNGYNAGKTTGEAIGYDKGVREANDYSFMSLFGAVIDAPIKAFSGLFNFEILGINLLDFFLGLLTFGVIIFVIKLLLGGK